MNSFDWRQGGKLDLVTSPRNAPGTYAFFYEIVNRAPILNDHFYPRPLAYLREIDPTKAQPRYQDVYSMTERLVPDRVDSFAYGISAV